VVESTDTKGTKDVLSQCVSAENPGLLRRSICALPRESVREVLFLVGSFHMKFGNAGSILDHHDTLLRC
jgi:hypothetical protein